MALSESLLSVLVCPRCKGALTYQASPEELLCATCRLGYRIQEGIPQMLPAEARALLSSGPA